MTDVVANQSVLLVDSITPAQRARLAQSYPVIDAVGSLDATDFPAEAHDVRAVLTKGTRGFSATEMDRLPQLGLICALGVGYEGIDVTAARRRGIAVTFSPGANRATVADHAFALLLAIVRDVVRLNGEVRAGHWEAVRGMPPSVGGKRLGILGLGQIGLEIAKRGAGGFDMEVGYHARSKRDVGYIYFADPLALAAWADFIVAAVPGGGSTNHLVGRRFLDAMKPASYLVNIARGSVVETPALIDRLRRGGIAGAALDVVEGEPEVPPELMALPNVILSPHMGGRSPEGLDATITMVCANLTAFFTGCPLLNPVPD